MLFYEEKIIPKLFYGKPQEPYIARLTDIYPRNDYARIFLLAGGFISITNAPADRGRLESYDLEGKLYSVVDAPALRAYPDHFGLRLKSVKKMK